MASITIALLAAIVGWASTANGDEASTARAALDWNTPVKGGSVENCFELWCPSNAPHCTSFHCGRHAVYASLSELDSSGGNEVLWGEITWRKVASCIVKHAPDGTQTSSSIEANVCLVPRRRVRLAKVALRREHSDALANATWPAWRPKLEACLKTALERPLSAPPDKPMSATVQLEMTPGRLPAIFEPLVRLATPGAKPDADVGPSTEDSPDTEQAREPPPPAKKPERTAYPGNVYQSAWQDVFPKSPGPTLNDDCKRLLKRQPSKR